MNDWNYTKKVGKIFFIYAITFWLSIKVAQFLTGPWIPTADNDFGWLYIILITLLSPLITPGLIILTPIHLFFPSLFTFFGDDLPLILCSGVISWIIIGFLMDLYFWNLNKKNPEGEIKKSQREKGVFIRIPFGSRKIVISEKFVNCFLITEIIFLVIFTIIIYPGIMNDNHSVIYENVVDGDYLKMDSTNHVMHFNIVTGNFIESYPNDTSENGTYEVNETFLTLYYYDGKMAEYNVSYGVNQLSPVNMSLFSSEEEWEDNWYMKELPN